MNNDIYISASRRDFETVSKIKSILHSAGYTYSGDIQRMQAASDFEQTIRAEIISSKVVLCVLSGNSSSSVYPKSVIRISLCRTAKRNPNDRFGLKRFLQQKTYFSF